MASRPVPAGFKTTQQVVDRASARGLKVDGRNIRKWITMRGIIRGAKTQKVPHGKSKRRHLIPDAEVNRIVDALERREKLRETHAPTEEINREIKRRRLEVGDERFPLHVARRNRAKIVTDPLFKNRHWIPRSQINEILFSALQLNAPRLNPGFLKPEEVSNLAGREGVPISANYITRMLNSRIKSGVIMEVAQYHAHGRPNWLISKGEARRIINYAKVKDKLGRYFTRATRDLDLKKTATLAGDIAQARRVGLLFTFRDAERELGLASRSLSSKRGVNSVTFGGTQYIIDKELGRLKKTVRPKGRAKKVSKVRRVSKKKKRRTRK